MITKRTLLTYINDLDEGFFALISRVQALEKEVENLKKANKTKRGPGRPKKTTQPRDKNGKFVKM